MEIGYHFYDYVGSGAASTYTIESGVSLNDVYMSVNGSGTVVNVEGRVAGTLSELEVGNGAILDLTKATLAATYLDYGINSGATMRLQNMAITRYADLQIEDNHSNDPCTVYLEGNLSLAGVSLNIATESRYTCDTDPLNSLGYIEINGDKVTLSVSGSITISSTTAILYYSSGGGWTTDESGNWVLPYGDPDPATPLFICSSINESGLKLLQPFAVKNGYDENGEEFFWYKPLLADDRFYYAVTGNDNLVYVYLGDGSITAGPDENDIVVGEGQDVVLEGENMPSSEKQVWLNGGTADASGLEDELLSNEIIPGKESGTLITTKDQTMSLVGNGSVNYSIEAATGSTSAAILEIGKTGASDVLKLNGAKYESATVNVNSGTVVIGGNTTLGLGNDATTVTLENGTELSNEGTVAAKITSNSGSTVTNLGSITGDVELLGNSKLNNNLGGSISGNVAAAGKVINYGTISGAITSSTELENYGTISGAIKNSVELVNNGTISNTLEAEGKVSGTGTFGATSLASTASLHVGNSPGYQKHDSLTIDRGATLSFSVDGITPASLTNYGNGTHSFLEADSLTINPGTGTVTVKVDVTMGILSAGSDPMSLTLMEVGTTTTATTADFTLALQDNSGLLEAGSTISFEDGKLKFNAAVSKAALAALMDSNSANVANTMWASANAVHEFARTAENQFLVGMPGQTTFWGAGIGSYMNVGGEQGFTSNSYGYAVGLQHAFTEKFRAGVALGQMFGSFQSDDNQLKVDQNAMMPVLTAQYVTKTGKISSVTVSGHIAYGIVENEAETYQAGTTGSADWEDEVFNIGVKVAWNVTLGNHVTTSLFTGLTYQQVEQDAFTERFTGGERDYRDGSMSSLSVPMGITIRGIYEMEGTNVFAPELTLAYIADISRDNPTVNTSVYGFNRVGEGSNLGRGAFMMQVGANWMFNSTMSVGAFYALEARRNQVNHSFNAALRCSF